MSKLIIMISIITIIYILYIFGKSSNHTKINNFKENYEASFKCRPSTDNNPFANYIITSKISNPMISACKDLNVGDNYMNNLYLNSENAYNRYFFNKNYLDHNFMTMPVTKNPNDLKKFGNFLYNNKNWLECKTDKYCLPWTDLRYKNKYINK